MSGLFKKPKIKVIKPDPVPTIDTAAQNQTMLQRVLRKRKRQQAILGRVPSGPPASATGKSLLGS